MLHNIQNKKGRIYHILIFSGNNFVFVYHVRNIFCDTEEAFLISKANFKNYFIILQYEAILGSYVRFWIETFFCYDETLSYIQSNR